MKTIFIIILAGIACTFCANAQQYQAYLNKANIRSVSFKLKNSSLRIIGTTNDSLTITVLGAGPINLQDGDSIDLHLAIAGQTLLAEKTSETPKNYLVQIPKQIDLTIEEPFGPPQKLEIIDMDAAVNVHSWVSKITLTNNKGPANVKSEAADIFVTLPPGLDQPYSLTSRGRLVDVTIPQKDKITLDAEIVAGRLITDFSLNKRVETVIGDSLQTVKGPLNGGGTKLMVKANTLVLH